MEAGVSGTWCVVSVLILAGGVGLGRGRLLARGGFGSGRGMVLAVPVLCVVEMYGDLVVYYRIPYLSTVESCHSPPLARPVCLYIYPSS